MCGFVLVWCVYGYVVYLFVIEKLFSSSVNCCLVIAELLVCLYRIKFAS